MDISTIAAELNRKETDIINVVRDECPGYDKHIHCKVKQPKKYGIRLIRPAEKRIERAFGVKLCAPRRADNRSLQARLQCRTTEELKTWVHQCFMADGCPTIQDGLTMLIREYLKGKEIWD